MDSGNSASLQSSSGGDDNQEYDSSRAVADHNSTFSSLQNNTTSMFDPFANYFNPTSIISRPQNLQNYPSASLVNLDMSTDWSKTLRSESFGQSPGLSFPSAAAEHGSSSNVTVTTSAPAAAPMVATAPPQDQQPVRNPKKRSRASRRAPTTVLTTDTSNFRAMVQEFTGIPSPPFTAASSYFPRSRLDIFPNSSLRSGPSSTNHLPLNISQPPNYLRRPFPQKIQPPNSGPTSFLSPHNSSSPSSLLSCLANNTTTTSATSNSTNNYQLMMSSELGGLLKPQQFSSGVTNSVTQSSNLFTNNIQNNSILTSLLHEKYPLGSKEPSFEIPSNNNSQRNISHLGANILEEYGMSSTQHGLPNLISPEQAAASRNESNIHNGNNNKVQETVVSRGEGMVESWICSSDH